MKPILNLQIKKKNIINSNLWLLTHLIKNWIRQLELYRRNSLNVKRARVGLNSARQLQNLKYIKKLEI